MTSDNQPGKGLSVPKNPAMALRALNSRHAAVPEAAPPAEEENTTILQTDKPTNNTAYQPTNQQANKKTSKATKQPTNQPTDRMPLIRAAPAARPVPIATPQPEAPPRPRVDGRTLRIRQETSDRTMVTSMRLAVSTVEQLDEFCWRHRMRKQDVVQEALELYFRAVESEDTGQ